VIEIYGRTGGLGQIATASLGTVATGTTQIPVDNTIPQITEGNQYLSLAITPQSALSLLEIDVTLCLTNSVANTVVAALFQDAVANALACAATVVTTGGFLNQITFKHFMLAGTIAATTFTVRAGGVAAGTTTVNGSGGAQYFGGAFASRMTIKEWLP